MVACRSSVDGCTKSESRDVFQKCLPPGVLGSPSSQSSPLFVAVFLSRAKRRGSDGFTGGDTKSQEAQSGAPRSGILLGGKIVRREVAMDSTLSLMLVQRSERLFVSKSRRR